MKYCTKCGAQLMDEAVMCTKCGCMVELVRTPRRQSGVMPSKQKQGAFSALLAVANLLYSFFFHLALFAMLISVAEAELVTMSKKPTLTWLQMNEAGLLVAGISSLAMLVFAFLSFIITLVKKREVEAVFPSAARLLVSVMAVITELILIM